MSAGEICSVVVIFCVAFAAYYLGQIDGERKERRRNAQSVAAMEKIRGMANWIMTAEKFTGSGATPYCDVTYQLDDEMFAIRLSRVQFEKGN